MAMADGRADGQTGGRGCCDGRSGRWRCLLAGHGYVVREDRAGGERGGRGETEEKTNRGKERKKEGKRLLLRLLTVSLEDLRLLMLEAREVLMDLKEAFFWGSGSALPLFLS